jgi:hypothetical protein|nr:MAG TPA: hypothetical protein [Caudoviricetes sp.]
MEKLKLKRKYVRPMKSYIDTTGILISYAHKNIDYEEE